MYTRMQTITTSEARKHFSRLVNLVRYSNRPVAIGRRNKAEALLIRFPDALNPTLSEMTNMNQYGGAFQFLEDEPDFYTPGDLKVPYV